MEVSQEAELRCEIKGLMPEFTLLSKEGTRWIKDGLGRGRGMEGDGRDKGHGTGGEEGKQMQGKVATHT